MIDISILEDCDDVGFVIYDKKKKLYFCGLKKWSNQLRQAKVYHSIKHLREMIDSLESNNLIIRKVALIIVNSYDYDEMYLGSNKRELNKKRESNKKAVNKLNIGDKVEVIKTKEVGTVTGFVVYGTGQEGETYDYTSVKVKFSDDLPPRKRNRRFSGTSLRKLP